MLPPAKPGGCGESGSIATEGLTPQERKVFALLVRGLPNKQIAHEFRTSLRTVKAHRAELMHKMGVQSPVELGRAVEWLGEVFEASPAAGMERLGRARS